MEAPWLFASGVVTFFVLAPVAALAVTATGGSPELWQHLFAYVLPVAARDTIILLLGVGLVAGVVGTGSAWLVTAYDFPGRRTFTWALLLPLAVPTYIVAYAYLDVLHPVGPVQSALRALLGFDSPRQFRLPDVRSMTGCILLLGFVLYPYVYLTTRAMFLMQASNLLDVARTLGAGRGAVFFRVALPLARPAIAVGVSLALMEALNDIGAAEFLGVRTLTVSIYTTWVTRSDLPGAAQIAIAMLALVVGIVLVEQWARRRRRYANDAQGPRPMVPHRLFGIRAAAACCLALVPVVLGFLVPASYLVGESVDRVRFAGVSPALVTETWNTVALSLLATVLTVTCALVVVYAVRVTRTRAPAMLARAASIGYAIPGSVLAIGILPVAIGADRMIDAVWVPIAGASVGLLVLGSGAALLYAYLVRFLAIAAGGIESGLSRVSPSLDEAARTLGDGAIRRLRRIHLPLTRPALLSAALLVFVDCMKELPATLLLRPVGFETLATHLYAEAARGTYEDAALAALLIVLGGLVPVVILARVDQAVG
ncbi:MAG TPA: iron ABC transporter permease [Vicinamibacterales bacterium]|nr:iron ABC transporter permease [Vicinamibacterales bacterium]